MGRRLNQIIDWFIPGNAYNSNTGHWNPATTTAGIAGIIADQLIPGGSNIVGMAGRNGLFGSDFANNLKNENIYNTMADQYGDFRAGLKDQYLNPSVDLGGNPQVSVGQPQYASIGGFAPLTSAPTQQAPTNSPWTPLGTSTGNLFQGGSLGSWANGGGMSSQPSVGQENHNQMALNAISLAAHPGVKNMLTGGLLDTRARGKA